MSEANGSPTAMKRSELAIPIPRIRDFEHAKVFVDLEKRKGKIQWLEN
jgi:hypothetical protein